MALLTDGVLDADGVPMSRAPSGPTDATTLPELVANTSRVGVIWVITTSCCAIRRTGILRAKRVNASTVETRRYARRRFTGTLPAVGVAVFYLGRVKREPCVGAWPRLTTPICTKFRVAHSATADR